MGNPGSTRTGFSTAADTAPEEYSEISLADIVRVLHRRKVVLAITIVLALVGGGALTVLTTPTYEAEVGVIPLEHAEIIRGWLESRQAAEVAATSVGAPLYAVLFESRWDSASGTWAGPEPSRAEIGQALLPHVKVSGGGAGATAASRNAPISVTVTLTSAAMAAEVAQAYMSSLDQLRPQLEEITRSNLFDRYYDGTNAQEAQARAETAAREKNYWIVFDSPTVPDSPASPRPMLNMALAGVLGVMMGVFVVFFLEWLDRYRAEFQRVEAPPRP